MFIEHKNKVFIKLKNIVSNKFDNYEINLILFSFFIFISFILIIGHLNVHPDSSEYA